MHRLVAVAFALACVAGCQKHITIYKSLSEPGAMQSCDANAQFRAEADGADEAEARHNGHAAIRKLVRENDGCGALVINDGAGSKIGGGYHYAGNFQLCHCR